MALRVSPARRIMIEGIARAAALGAFALMIYVVGYRPATRSDSYVDIVSLYTNTIGAANDGYPFATYSQRDATRLVRIDEFASGYYDPGLPALISVTSIVGRATVGEQFKVDKRTIYQIVFGLCVLAGLVSICPTLPLPVSFGALAALAASILIPVDGRNAFDWPRWWEAYSAVLVGMLVVGLVTARRSRWRPLYFVGLTILASCSRLLREEVVVTAYAALSAFVATMLALWLVARWRERSPSVAAAIWRLLRRCVVVGAVFCLGLAASPYLLRGAIAVAWGIPFAETTTAVHSAGHSLYLSLGHVPNPYAISWRDNVAMSHSHLIDPTVRVEDPRYQDVLRREAIRIMLESPWLVWANVIQKGRDTAGYLGTSAGLRKISVLALLATVGSLFVLVRYRRPRLLALWGGLLGLGAGASAPALLIHPEYSFGTQAVVILLAFVVPPAMLSALRSDAMRALAEPALDLVQQSRRITEWAAVFLGLGVLIVGVSTVGWYAIRASRYVEERAAIAASQRPLADLERQGYRYARYFNDLPVNAQERLIAEMSATNDPRVAVPVPVTTLAGFRPVLAVYTSRQLHVIAWLDRDEAVAKFAYGSAQAFVGYCVSCQHVREDLPNDAYSLDDAHVRLDVAGIHNMAWADRYELLSIPVDTTTPPTGDVLLALQQIVSWNGTAFALKTEGTWRARFQ